MYSQTLWTISEARRKIDPWIKATGVVLPDNFEVELVNRVADNCRNLGTTHTYENAKRDLMHKIVINLPKVVEISKKRNLDPETELKDTVLHELAHVLHNVELAELVETHLIRTNRSTVYRWTVWRDFQRKRQHSSHGTRWREIAVRVGATPRATVKTAIAQVKVNGPSKNWVEDLAKAIVTRPAPVAAKRTRSKPQVHTQRVTRDVLCESCFTKHGPGQGSECW